MKKHHRRPMVLLRLFVLYNTILSFSTRYGIIFPNVKYLGGVNMLQLESFVVSIAEFFLICREKEPNFDNNSFLTYRGNANIAETYEANRRAWRSCTTLSCLYSIIIPFRDSHAFLHDQADRGTQRPGYGLDLFRFSYCGRQNHRRFWLPRWKPRPLRLTLRSRNHPG